jgi:hypothetical protein
MRYAQLDDNNKVISVSDLSGEIQPDHPLYKYMIKLGDGCPMGELLGLKFDGLKNGAPKFILD